MLAVMSYALPAIAATPEDPATRERWEHTSLRRRILEGRHEHDVRARYIALLGPTRARQHGIYLRGAPDLSSNLVRQVAAAQSTLYDLPTTWDHPDQFSARFVSEVLRNAGHQSYMQRVQRNTVALNEYAMHIEVTGSGGRFHLRMRPVPPDLIEAWALPAQPDVPVRVREALPRQIDGQWRFVYHDTSIEPGNVYRRVTDDRGYDVSPLYLVDSDGRPAPVGGFVGDGYLERDAAGEPILPWVLYHAARTGHLFDPYEGCELVDGALNTCVLWGLWQHLVRDASWPQRVLVDGQAQGADEFDGVHEVTTDPSTVMMLETSQRILEAGAGRATVSQWQPGGDPESMQKAIGLYERRVLGGSGVSNADAQRVAGDARSGFALAINRSAQRESQAQYRPTFERGDTRLAHIVAVLLNMVLPGAGLPETGYTPVYQGIPLSGDELQSVTADVLQLRAASPALMTHRQALRRIHPELSDEQLDRLIIELNNEGDPPKTEDTQ